MKNILKTLTVTAVMVGMSGGVALADSDCDGNISNTGPGSDNSITCEVTNETRVSCVNGIYIVNNNDQEAGSGDGEVEGNTSGGNATSGSAVNENGTVVQIGTSCGDAELATPPAPTTPTTPGRGAGGAGGQVLGEAVSAQQVAFKPVGGAGAGTGSAVSSGNAAATTGVLASASLIAAGLALRKQALGRN